MAKKMAAKAKAPVQASGEWVCELASFPAHIDDPAGSYQPDGLLWADTEGKVLGFRIGRPGTVLAEAGASFREATKKPMSGKPHVPASIRAGAEERAEALRAVVGPGVVVYVGETPETAAALAAMAESFEGDSAPATHFGKGIQPADVAALYRAAARLYRSAPWKKVAAEHGTFTVSSPALGLTDAVVIVLGHLGEQYGILLFPSVGSFESFLSAVASIQMGREATIPSHCAVTFEPRSEVRPGLLEEIRTHAFEVAGPAAYPAFAVLDEKQSRPVLRGPDARELRLMEAVSLALAGHLEAARPGPRGAVTVALAEGPVEVVLEELPETPDEPPAKPAPRKPPKAAAPTKKKAR